MPGRRIIAAARIGFEMHFTEQDERRVDDRERFDPPSPRSLPTSTVAKPRVPGQLNERAHVVGALRAYARGDPALPSTVVALMAAPMLVMGGVGVPLAAASRSGPHDRAGHAAR